MYWVPIKPGGKENDPDSHDKIRDPVELVLALALTVALAACGSDEPSGVTGPDRTTSTPTETPASPAPTPTTPGAGDAPTATDTPVPAASGSVKTDREALVALYNATDRENWENNANWLSDAPLGELYGVSTHDDGRVKQVGLHRNALSGEIPAELGSLSNLFAMQLTDNSLSGEIPAELGSLSKLLALDLGGNQLSGEIPAELGGLSILGFLGLGGNQLSGCVPSSLEDQVDRYKSELGDLPFC